MRYNKYSERILVNNANDELAVNDVERYKRKQNEDVDEIMRDEDDKKPILNPKKIRVISEEQKNNNFRKINEFSEMLGTFNSQPLDLKSSLPSSSRAEAYLEEVTNKAYKTTLKVNSDDIEKKIPPQVLEVQNYYQRKHDKLLELFYNKFPIADGDRNDIENISGMEKSFVKLGKEIIELKKKYKSNPNFSKYVSIFERMTETLKIAYHKLKDLKSNSQ